MRIEGAGAVVAGGASGLGAASARALAGSGAKVVIADLNADLDEIYHRYFHEKEVNA